MLGSEQGHLAAARRALRSLGGWLSRRLSPATSRFLLSKVRLIPARPPLLGNLLAGHKRLSRNLDSAPLAALMAQELEPLSLREDVHFQTPNWSLPVQPAPAELAEALGQWLPVAAMCEWDALAVDEPFVMEDSAIFEINGESRVLFLLRQKVFSWSRRYPRCPGSP